MIRLFRRRYLLIQNDGLTRLNAPLQRYWLRSSAECAQRNQTAQRASEGYGERYSYRVAVR